MTLGDHWLAVGRTYLRSVPWRAVVGYAAFTIAVFTIALLRGLPHDLIAHRAVDAVAADLPVRISFADVAFAFPNGYSFERVRIAPLDRPDRSIEIRDLTVRLPLGSLLFGRADSAEFSGHLYGGSFDGDAAQDDGAITARLAASEIRLGPLSRMLVPPPGVVEGSASLEVRAEGRGRRFASGTLDVRVHDLSLQGLVAQGFTLPDLRFDDVALEAAIEGTRLRLDKAKATGAELSVGAKGDVLLRDPTERSVLNLDVEIEVAPEARPGLRVATALLPKRGPGQPASWSLRGSLASPSLR